MSTLRELNMKSVIIPILAWPILDSFGDMDTKPVRERLERFLTRIYLFLFMGNGIHKQQRAMRPTMNDAQQSATNEKIPESAKTLSELNDHIEAGGRSPLAREMFQKFHDLFKIFIPDEHDQNWISIQLYWGTVFEIYVSG